MKNIRRLSGILAVCCFPFAAVAAETANDQQVLAILRPVADAAMRGDFAAGIEVMYDPLAQELGGKPKLVEAVGVLKEQMRTQNLKLVRQEFVPPLRFVQGAKRRYVIVPTITELQTPTGLMRAHGFQLGVEVTPGVWQFVDGAKVTRPLISKYFSDFPLTEKLPETRHETIAPPVGAR
jgi:hypothetical protein